MNRDEIGPIAAKVYDDVFNHPDVMAALAQAWPDLSDLAMTFALDYDPGPLNPSGAPAMSMEELALALRVQEWGEPTASHIVALERAVSRLNALRWPSFGRGGVAFFPPL